MTAGNLPEFPLAETLPLLRAHIERERSTAQAAVAAISGYAVGAEQLGKIAAALIASPARAGRWEGAP